MQFAEISAASQFLKPMIMALTFVSMSVSYPLQFSLKSLSKRSLNNQTPFINVQNKLVVIWDRQNYADNCCFLQHANKGLILFFYHTFGKNQNLKDNLEEDSVFCLLYYCQQFLQYHFYESMDCILQFSLLRVHVLKYQICVLVSHCSHNLPCVASR